MFFFFFCLPQVGRDGVITVKDGKTLKDELEVGCFLILFIINAAQCFPSKGWTRITWPF